MKIRLAERLAEVKESATLKMNAAARELSAKGVKVVNLTAGELDFPVFPAIKQATKDAIDKNASKYTPVPGNLELRQEIAAKLKSDNGLDYKPDQVVVSAGAKQAIFNCFAALLNSGDEVLIPAPYWVSYPDIAKLFGGRPVILDSSSKSGFKITADQVKRALTPKTKILVLNYPSNPTGTLYDESELRAIAKVLEGTDVVVVSDEIYEKLVYEGKFISFAALSADAFSRTITVNGYSKSFAMTGWRLGYAAGPKEIMSAMALIQGQSTSGASSITQRGVLGALARHSADIEKMRLEMKSRRDRFCSLLAQVPSVSFVQPAGAFYVFLNVGAYVGRKSPEGNVLSDVDALALYLLEAVHVGTVSGAGFGAPDCLRLSFSGAEDELVRGVELLSKGLQALSA